MSATSMGRRLLQVRGGGTETIYKAAIELCVALHVVICEMSAAACVTRERESGGGSRLAWQALKEWAANAGLCGR
jgi:hypothetical protein